MAKKSAFSSINKSIRAAKKSVSTAKKVGKALSPDYEYNILTGRYVKRKKK